MKSDLATQFPLRRAPERHKPAVTYDFVAYRALTCLFFSAASQAVAQGGNANAIASSSKSLSWYLVL